MKTKTKRKRERGGDEGQSEKIRERGWKRDGRRREKRIAAGTASVGEKKRIGNYPWIVRKCSKDSTARTSEPSGKWTMEIVGEAAMAWRLYKGAAVKDIAIPLFLPREPATEPSLSIEGKCPTEWHPPIKFSCVASATITALPPTTFRITFLRLTPSDNDVTARSPHLMLDKPKVWRVLVCSPTDSFYTHRNYSTGVKSQCWTGISYR